jgi:DNA primase
MTKPSIVEVIGQRVELRKAGKEYKGLCPFHSEKTPSLTVNEDKGLFYCFGCSASGDVIDFIMQLDGVGFP